MSGSHRRRVLEIVGSIRCNSRLVVLADGTETGRRHDVRHGRTARSVEVVTRLLQKRRHAPDLNPGYRRR